MEKALIISLLLVVNSMQATNQSDDDDHNIRFSESSRSTTLVDASCRSAYRNFQEVEKQERIRRQREAEEREARLKSEELKYKQSLQEMVWAAVAERDQKKQELLAPLKKKREKNFRAMERRMARALVGI